MNFGDKTFLHNSIQERSSIHLPPQLVNKSEPVCLKSNVYIIEQGCTLDYVYILKSGKIGIYNISYDGSISRIVHLYPGNIIGEMEVLCNIDEAVFSAKTYEPCEIIKITRKDFMHYLKLDPSFLYDITNTLAKKLYFSATAVYQHIRNDAVGKLCIYIMDYVKDEIAIKPSAIIAQTRADIANSCGVSERTVNRSIKYLQNKGLIGIVKGKISITRQQYNKLRESDSIYSR